MSSVSPILTWPKYIIAGPQQLWNTACTLKLYLASKRDAAFNYVTFNVSDAVRSGFYLNDNIEAFKARFAQGDMFKLILDGRLAVDAKINRRTCDTMAFTCPRSIEMPVWRDGSTVVEVKVAVIGYTGLRQLPKTQKLHLPVESRQLELPSLVAHPAPLTSSVKSPYPAKAAEPTQPELVQILITGPKSMTVHTSTDGKFFVKV